ncbi:MAG: gliding motility-associated C-terminal domain-containing protein [Bacteroidota bacterium]|nr:gliding motility-associated C-terminal domain-containing protein [Bacteroidota bacterium]
MRFTLYYGFLYFIGLMHFFANAKGQSIINKSQLITIAPNTHVTVSGNFINEGIVINQGSISVSGDWQNLKEYDHSIGTMIFNGEKDQVIDHNDQVFYDLEINGLGKKILKSNIVVSHKLILINGILYPENDQYLLLGRDASLKGGSETSYINGAFYHTGTGYKYFPIGKDGHFRPVTLLNIEGIQPVVGLEVFSNNPYQRYGTLFKSISSARYWRLTQMEGTFNGSLVTLSLGEDDGIQDPGQLLLAEMDNQEEIFKNIGQSGFIRNVSGLAITSEKPVKEEVIAVGIYSGFSDNRVLYVPNVLYHSATDPENKTIKVYGEEIDPQGFLFRIYNRWGIIIFESSSYDKVHNEGWRGTNTITGEEESNGVYIYTLSGKFKSGVPIKEKGRITILQ